MRDIKSTRISRKSAHHQVQLTEILSLGASIWTHDEVLDSVRGVLGLARRVFVVASSDSLDSWRHGTFDHKCTPFAHSPSSHTSAGESPVYSQ